MATRWMRWNPGTHIFEYSTDGVLFNILPLDASIINEGTIDMARLPAGLPSTGGSNVFTGLIPITLSGVTPQLTFYETDQATGNRSTRIAQEIGNLYFQKQSDAGGGLGAINLAILNRQGQLLLYPSTSGVVFDVTAALNNALVLSLRNTDPGTNRYCGIQLGNDVSGPAGGLYVASSGWTSGGFVTANGLALRGDTAAGVNIAAGHASGIVRFFSGANASPSGWFATDGSLHIYRGTLIAYNGIIEYSRAFYQGFWVDVPYNAANFTSTAGTWTVAAGNIGTYRYTIIGKTMFLQFSCSLTTISSPTVSVSIKIPDYLPGSTVSFWSACYNGTAWNPGYTTFGPGNSFIQIYGGPGSTGWPACAGTAYVSVMATIPLA